MVYRKEHGYLKSLKKPLYRGVDLDLLSRCKFYLWYLKRRIMSTFFFFFKRSSGYWEYV